jgi:hypothetical protein
MHSISNIAESINNSGKNEIREAPLLKALEIIWDKIMAQAYKQHMHKFRLPDLTD